MLRSVFLYDPEWGVGAPKQVEMENKPGRFWPCPIYLPAVCCFWTRPFLIVLASWDSLDGGARAPCGFLIGSSLGDPHSLALE